MLELALDEAKSFDAALLLKLRERVEAASWDLAEVARDYHSPDGVDLLEALYQLVEAMPADAQPLTLDLIQHLRIVYNYRPYAWQMAAHIRTTAQSITGGRVILLPVKEPNDATNNSGNSLVYEIATILSKYTVKNVLQYDTPFSSDISIQNNDVVYFVDDFVGSGNQYSKMWQRFSAINRGTGLVIFRGIVAMQKGLEKIQSLGHQAAAVFIMEPCISSGLYVSCVVPEQAARIYSEAEKSLSIKPYYRSGYGNSQSLAVLKKTPNNTLPIFWAMKMKGGKKWPAPFPEMR